MKFLNVFCVVLCVRSGAFLHIQNNVPDIRYQNQEAIQLSTHRNTKIPLNNPYYDKFRQNQPIGRFREQLEPPQNVQFESQRITPEYINLQQIKNTNEQLLNKKHTGNQGHYFKDQAHPMYINPPIRKLIEVQSNSKEDVSKTTLKENIRLESQRISPKYLNWQQTKNTNEKLINQEDSISQRGQYFQQQTHPEHILPEAKKFNEAQHTPEENISRSKLQFSDIHVRHNVLPLKHVDTGSVLTNSKNINTLPIKRLNEAKLMPVEDTKLELQAVSPEYIKSFINEDKPELMAKLSSPYEKVNNAKVVKHLDNEQFHSNNHFEQDEATYVNPSAEVLYSTKRALPYEIAGQQLPNISQGGINFYSNANSPERILDIQKLMQPSKRYMIIHPDGRVEHIDEIEKITKIHPNYVMIKSQDFLKRIEGKSGISGLQISQLFANNPHDAIVNQKHNQAPHHLTDIPSGSGHKSPPQFGKNPLYSKDTDSLGKLIVSNEPNIHPTQIKTDKVYSQISSENKNQHDENLLLNKENMHGSSNLVPEIENHEKNNYIKNEQTLTQFTPIVKENEFKNIELTSVSPSDIQQIPTKNEQIFAYDSAPLASSTIATITEENDDNFNKTVITKVNKTENTTSPFVNLTLNDNLPTSSHERQIILNEESAQYNSSTLLVPITSMSTPAIITESSIKNMNEIVPYQNSTGTLENSTGTILNTIIPNTTQAFYTNHETSQNINNELSDTLSSTTRPEIGAISNTTATSVSIPNKTSFSTNDQEESTDKNVTNIMQTLNVTSPSTTPLSNTENTTNNTGFWFQADEQFWHNIMTNNDTQNLFYFYFVPPKSNIMQKETKTTLYPNGTTVEEVIETIDEDGVQRVIRTTKVFLNSTSPDA